MGNHNSKSQTISSPAGGTNTVPEGEGPKTNQQASDNSPVAAKVPTFDAVEYYSDGDEESDSEDAAYLSAASSNHSPSILPFASDHSSFHQSLGEKATLLLTQNAALGIALVNIEGKQNPPAEITAGDKFHVAAGGLVSPVLLEDGEVVEEKSSDTAYHREEVEKALTATISRIEAQSHASLVHTCKLFVPSIISRSQPRQMPPHLSFPKSKPVVMRSPTLEQDIKTSNNIVSEPANRSVLDITSKEPMPVSPPTTHADATNLALKYPEHAKDILAMPISTDQSARPNKRPKGWQIHDQFTLGRLKSAETPPGRSNVATSLWGPDTPDRVMQAAKPMHSFYKKGNPGTNILDNQGHPILAAQEALYPSLAQLYIQQAVKEKRARDLFEFAKTCDVDINDLVRLAMPSGATMSEGPVGIPTFTMAGSLPQMLPAEAYRMDQVSHESEDWAQLGSHFIAPRNQQQVNRIGQHTRDTVQLGNHFIAPRNAQATQEPDYYPMDDRPILINQHWNNFSDNVAQTAWAASVPSSQTKPEAGHRGAQKGTFSKEQMNNIYRNTPQDVLASYSAPAPSANKTAALNISAPGSATVGRTSSHVQGNLGIRGYETVANTSVWNEPSDISRFSAWSRQGQLASQAAAFADSSAYNMTSQGLLPDWTTAPSRHRSVSVKSGYSAGQKHKPTVNDENIPPKINWKGACAPPRQPFVMSGPKYKQSDDQETSVTFQVVNKSEGVFLQYGVHTSSKPASQSVLSKPESPRVRI